MRKHKLIWVLMVLVAAISGCSSDPEVNPEDGEQTVIKGVVYKIAPAEGMTVNAFLYDNAGFTDSKGSTVTDTTGNFEIKVGAAYGNFVIVAESQSKALAAVVLDVKSLSTVTGIQVSGFTTLSAAYCRYLTSKKSMQAVAAKEKADRLIFEHFGNITHLITAPAVPTETAPRIDNSIMSGILLLALEHQAQEASVTAGLLDFVDILAADIESDGYFNGYEGSYQLKLGSMDLDGDTLRPNYATAIIRWLASDKNPTIFVEKDVNKIIMAIADNNSEIFDCPPGDIDRVPPTLTIVKPTASEEVVATIDVEAEAVDGEGHLLEIEVVEPEQVAGSSSIDPGGETGTFSGTLNTTSYPDGDLTITLKALDSAGNFTEESVLVKVRNGGDKFGPSFFYNVESETPTRENVFAVSGKVTDNSGVSEMTIDGVQTSWDAEGIFSSTLKTLKDGENNWSMWAKDALSNETSEVYTIFKDQVQPTITVLTPQEDDTFISGEYIDIDATASDTYGIESLKVSIEGSIIEDIEPAPEELFASVPADDYDEGSLDLLFEAIDRAGNSKSKTVRIEIKKTGGITGDAIKGEVSGAEVTAYEWDGSEGARIDQNPVNTNSNGRFTILVGPHDGGVLLKSKDGSYRGEGREPYDAPVYFGTNKFMSSLVDHQTGTSLTGVKITPFTTIAAILAENLVSQGSDPQTAMVTARERIQNIYQIDLYSDPVNCRTEIAPGFNSSAKYGLLLAGLSWLGSKDLESFNALEVLSRVYEDLSADGLLNGKGQGGLYLSLGEYYFDANTMRAKLGRAVKQFLDSDLNVTGMYSTAIPIKTWMDDFSSSMDPIFDPSQPPIPVDVDAPVISCTSHADNEWVRGGATIITEATDDDVTESFEVTDPKPMNYSLSVISPQTQRITIELQTDLYPDGGFSIIYKASDRSTNESNFTQNVRIDNTGPQVDWVYPQPGETIITTEGQIACSGTVLDVGVGFKSLSVNGVAAVVTGINWIVTIPVTPASFEIELVVEDTLGNATTIQRTVTIVDDIVNPVISFLTHVQNEWVRGNITITALATDDQEMKSFEITSPSGLTPTLNVLDSMNFELTFGLNTASKPDGELMIYYKALDHVDNIDEMNLALRIDNTEPIVTWSLAGCSGTVKTGTGSITCSGTINDGSGSGVAGLAINGVDATISGTDWSVVVPVVDFTTNTIDLSAEDAVGNVESLSRSVYVDADYTAPTVTWQSPTPPHDTWYKGTTTTVRAHASDDIGGNLGLSYFEVKCGTATVTDQSGSDADSTEGEIETTFNTSGTGTRICTATARDNSSVPNETQISRTIKYDNSGPALDVVSPEEGSTVDVDEVCVVQISGTATDLGSGLDKVLVNGGYASLNGDNWSRLIIISGSPSSMGVLVVASDNLGNETTEVRTFNINLTMGSCP